MSAAPRERQRQYIFENHGLQARRIAVDEKEERILGQKLPAQFYKGK